MRRTMTISWPRWTWSTRPWTNTCSRESGSPAVQDGSAVARACDRASAPSASFRYHFYVRRGAAPFHRRKRTQTQTAFTQPMPLPGNNGHAGPSVARTNVPAAASHAVPGARLDGLLRAHCEAYPRPAHHAWHATAFAGNQMHPALQRAAAPSKSGSRAPGQGFTGRGPSAGRGSGGAVAAVAVTAGAVVAGPVAAGAPRGGAWSQRPTPPQGSNAVLTQSHPMPGDAGEAGRHGAKRPREGQGGAWGAGGGGYQPRPGAAPHAPAGAVSRAAEAALAGQAAGQAQGGPLHRQMESMQQEIQRMGRAVAEREANISLLRDRGERPQRSGVASLVSGQAAGAVRS